MNKTSLIIFSVLISVSVCGGCQSGTTNVNVSTTSGANANVGGANANSNIAVTDASPSSGSASNSSADAPAGSPSAAYVAFFNARNSKDIAALKRLMSKDVLEFFTEMQQAEKRTLDAALMELCETPQAPKAEVRNEKISGDTAVLEYKDAEGGWQRVDFIKEDGTWKLTIPKEEIRQMKPPTDQNKG